MKASLIIVANNRLPHLNKILSRHRYHGFETIVVFVGTPTGEVEADVLLTLDGPLGLAGPRNLGARQARGEWLLFADGDTYYQEDLGSLLDGVAWRGDVRRDVDDFGGQPGRPYTVVAGPMAIKRDLFFEMGGYHEGFINYGYEDADFLHKLWDYGVDVPCKDAGALHVLSIHRELAGPDWVRGDLNRELFERRLGMPVLARIAEDRAGNRGAPPTEPAGHP